ncbi:MAG: extracellular solute-binding protein, partial [Ardenticatenaceae bacterium]
IQTGTPPTLAFVRPPDIAAYADADALLPLDSLVEEENEEDYFAQFFDSVRYPGAGDDMLAWPVHRHQTLLFINRTRVEALGGNGSPGSLEELVQLCARYREQSGERCFALFPGGPLPMLWIGGNGGELMDENGKRSLFEEEVGQSVLRWLGELRAVDSVYVVPTYDAKVEAFASGKALFTFDSTQAIPTYEERINATFEMAAIPSPTTSGKPVTLTTGGNVAIFRGSPELQTLAGNFLAFWTSTEINYRWADAVGAFPVRRSALDKLKAQWPASSHLRQAAEWLPACRSVPPLKQWTEIEQVLQQAMIDTINGQVTPPAALAEVLRRAEGLLEP